MIELPNIYSLLTSRVYEGKNMTTTTTTDLVCSVTHEGIDLKVFNYNSITSTISSSNGSVVRNHVRFLKSPLARPIIPELSKYKVTKKDTIVIKLRKQTALIPPPAMISSSSSSSLSMKKEKTAASGGDDQITPPPQYGNSVGYDDCVEYGDNVGYEDWTSLVKRGGDPSNSTNSVAAAATTSSPELSLLKEWRQQGSDQVKQVIDKAIEKKLSAAFS
jgi:hypothetical protein